MNRLTRPNEIVIDSEAIHHNVFRLRHILGSNRLLFATLKADAYGFGLIPAAQTVLQAGADAVAVADLDDAVRLRETGVVQPILLFAGNLSGVEETAAMEEHRVIGTVHDDESLASLSRNTRRALDVVVKVDVGQDRLGQLAEQADDLVAAVSEHKKLRLYGVTTHLHTPELDTSVSYLQWQDSRFRALLTRLAERGVIVPFAMAASSSTIQAGVDNLLDGADPGSLLFGMRPPGEVRVDLDLRPAFTELSSRVVHVKDVHRNAFVAEGLAGTGPTRVAVLPIGQYDGIDRFHAGHVLIDGIRCPILGSPALEYMRVDVGHVSGVHVGSKASFVGEQGGVRISVEDVIRYQGHRDDEVFPLLVRDSVPRRYARAPAVQGVEREG